MAEKVGRGWSRHGLRCHFKRVGLRLLVIEGSKEGRDMTRPVLQRGPLASAWEIASWSRPEVLREGSGRTGVWRQVARSMCMLLWQVTCCFCHRAQSTVLTVYLSSPLDSKVDPFPIFFQALVGRTLGPSSILHLIPLDILPPFHVPT